MGGIRGHQEQKSYASYIVVLIVSDPRNFERFGKLVECIWDAENTQAHAGRLDMLYIYNCHMCEARIL